MEDLLLDIWNSLSTSPQMLAMSGLAAGVLVLFFGLMSLGRTPAEVKRMQVGSRENFRRTQLDLVRDDDFDLGGLLRAFVPSSKSERTRIGRRLRKAGILRKNAIYIYYVARAFLAIVLPALFFAWVTLPATWLSFVPPAFRLAGMDMLKIFQVATALTVAGFYSPALWLHAKIASRRERIRHSLPNALDLLQVAVEAGLGFDAAMLRVSRELAQAAPDISQEFMMMQLEIQAGKDRDNALMEMADRTDCEESKAFANVLIQAAQFGTSVSQALSTFAVSLREDRELKAQEKANRLPVQMSAVMALCMMPVLLMICLAPMAIRWIRMFGTG